MDQFVSQLKSLSDSIHQIKSDMVIYFDAKLDPIATKINSIENSLSTLNEHVTHLEQRVGATEDNLNEYSGRIKRLEKDNAYLLNKVDELENRSRSLNLRFIGVSESTEGRDTLGFMAGLIQQLLGLDNFPSPPTLERAHRVPIVRRADVSRPRPILIKLAHFQDKVKILRLSRRNNELVFNGKRVFIFPDYSAELMKRRRAFDPVKKLLRDLDLKYSLRYPCTLCVWVDGVEKHFHDHKTAEAAFSSFEDSSMNSSTNS